MYDDPALLEKIRQQFDSAPYPNIPLDASPKENYDLLFTHSLVTPYYLRHQKFIPTEGKLILDAGCGTGSKSLALAIANPGAKIIGIDLSEQSIDLAQKRLRYHQIENAEFHVLAIEDLPKLGLQFDYINCDEVLYLFPSIANALRAMKSVLTPRGIIRGNLHSALQRAGHFRAQQLFSLMGLMDSNPEDLEIEIAIDTMRALKDDVDVKRRTYHSNYEGKDKKQIVLMNYLFQGDKGYTIPEMFAALREAGLDFISMVNWRKWELLDLFKDSNDLPAFWAMSLPELSVEDRLRVFELIQPIHRLLDFWCTTPDATSPVTPLTEWTDADWEKATIYLHPVLQTERFKEGLLEAITDLSPFNIGRYLPNTAGTSIELEIVRTAACLLPLWDGGQRIHTLVERYCQLRPCNLITLKATTRDEAFAQVREFLTHLEVFMYVLVAKD